MDKAKVKIMGVECGDHILVSTSSKRSIVVKIFGHHGQNASGTAVCKPLPYHEAVNLANKLNGYTK